MVKDRHMFRTFLISKERKIAKSVQKLRLILLDGFFLSVMLHPERSYWLFGGNFEVYLLYWGYVVCNIGDWILFFIVAGSRLSKSKFIGVEKNPAAKLLRPKSTKARKK